MRGCDWRRWRRSGRERRAPVQLHAEELLVAGTSARGRGISFATLARSLELRQTPGRKINMSTYKIIGGDRREYGPVSASELRRWIGEGRLNAESQVRAEGDSDWKTLRAFPEFADALHLPDAPPAITAAPANPTEWANQLLARESELRLGECLSSGLSFFTANAAFVVPAVFIAWLLNMMMAFLPIVGGILHLLLNGVVMGGLYLACLRRMRGEGASVGNIFDGFKLCFVQLMLVGAISGLLTQFGFLFCLLPGLYLLVAWTFAPVLVADKRLEFWSAMELSRKIVTRVWFQAFLLLLLVFLPLVLVQCFGMVNIGTQVFRALQEVGFDVTRMLPRMSEFMRDLMARSLIWALAAQVALLLCQFFAVGALMRAYENLFRARNA